MVTLPVRNLVPNGIHLDSCGLVCLLYRLQQPNIEHDAVSTSDEYLLHERDVTYLVPIVNI